MNSVVGKLDPFSKYITKSNYQSVVEKVEGHFTGLGIGSLIVNDTLYVLNVVKNSPADIAGIKSMDRILQLGNVDIAGNKKNLDDVRNIIKEYSNKDLDIIILDRMGNKKPLTVKILKIENQSIDRTFNIADSTIYIRISQFSNHTYREFMKVLEENAKDEKISKLIIDLRNNPGGYLREVTKILDQFFETAKMPLVKTVYNDGRIDVIKTSGRIFYRVNDIIVLINSNSASGSEVLAGVLQDYDRGSIVGKQSFGKGLVQEQFKLRNGGALRLTIANYFLPTGRSIQKPLDLDTNFVDTRSSHYEKQDTFISLKNGKPLISGGGIYPDIVLKDSDFDRMEYKFWESDSLFLNWSIQYIKSHPELYEIEEEKFIDNYKLDVNYDDFGEVLNTEDNKELFDAFLKAKTGFILFGKNTEGKLLFQYDTFIKAAMSD